jgi:hypothetical protein
MLFFLGLKPNFITLNMHQSWVLVGFVITIRKVYVDCVFDNPFLGYHCFLEGEAAERADLLFLGLDSLLDLSLFLFSVFDIVIFL